MTLHAIALLHVAPDVAHAAIAGLDPAPRLVVLDDAVAVHLTVPLAEEPEVIGAALFDLAGPIVALHEEPRGVPVYPDSYTLSARTWEAALEELGEAADWISLAETPLRGSTPGLDLSALGGMDPAAMMQGLDPAALQGLLGGQDPAAMMQAAMQMMARLAETGELETLARSMAGAMPQGALEGLTGGADLSALADHAQRALADRPDLERTLRQALEGASEPEDDEG